MRLAVADIRPSYILVGHSLGGLYVAPPNAQVLAAFVKGLGEMGFVEGQNISIESRYAQGDLARLLELAAELVRRRVAVVGTLGGPLPVRAERDDADRL
jgi:putative ABC transport system substrate-binding protein